MMYLEVTVAEEQECDVCLPAIEWFQKHRPATDNDEMTELMITILEANGQALGCGEMRSICLPLMMLMDDNFIDED